MRRIIRIFLLTFFQFAVSTSLFACKCITTSLDKRVRRAEGVFIGKYIEETPENQAEIQNNKPGLLLFEVIKSWKGVHKEYIGLDLGDFPKSSGTCPLLFKFDEDTEYLAFAYGKDLKIEVECSDTRPLKPRYNETMKEISKLDSYWFRFKARVWPF